MEDYVDSGVNGRIANACEVWNISQLPAGTVAQEIVASVGLERDAFEVALAVCADELHPEK